MEWGDVVERVRKIYRKFPDDHASREARKYEFYTSNGGSDIIKRASAEVEEEIRLNSLAAATQGEEAGLEQSPAI